MFCFMLHVTSHISQCWLPQKPGLNLSISQPEWTEGWKTFSDHSWKRKNVSEPRKELGWAELSTPASGFPLALPGGVTSQDLPGHNLPTVISNPITTRQGELESACIGSVDTRECSSAPLTHPTAEHSTRDWLALSQPECGGSHSIL